MEELPWAMRFAVDEGAFLRELAIGPEVFPWTLPLAVEVRASGHELPDRIGVLPRALPFSLLIRSVHALAVWYGRRGLFVPRKGLGLIGERWEKVGESDDGP